LQGSYETTLNTFYTRRKRLEKEAEKQVKRFERTPLGKRLASLREDARKQIERNVENLVGLLPIASSAEVKRLERKVTTLTRKVNALEKSGPTSSAASVS
jgi:hypothetical protein